MQTTARRKPATIETILAALAAVTAAPGWGRLTPGGSTCPSAPPVPWTPATPSWLRTVEHWLSPRDRVIALLPFYAGLRLGETVALDLADVQLSARKGLITVRSGKGGRYREIPVHAGLREHLALWISDERPGWPGAATSPALLLNRRGGRLSARGAHDILLAIAAEARLDPGFSGHVLRHTFGTRLVRDGHDRFRTAVREVHQPGFVTASAAPVRPLAGGGPGRRQGLQCPVQGAGQRYRAVQPGQAEQLPGPGPGADHLQAGPVRGRTPGRADQRREPGRINEADLVKVDY
jgi:hypothetical protein